MALITAWIWPFIRIASLTMTAPVFGTRTVPTRIRLGVAMVLTLVIAPNAPPMPAVEPFSGAGLMVTGHQVLIGLSLGFALRLVLVVLEVGGQLIAHLTGLGFASLVDPQSGVDVPVVSQFYIILATLMFLSLDGHLLMIQLLADSFVSLPVGMEGVGKAGLWSLAGQASWIFSSAVLMALPAIGALLTVNIAFGVMARAAPQLNIFAVGFPVTLVFGLLVVLFTLPVILDQLEGLFDNAFGFAQALVSGGP